MVANPHVLRAELFGRLVQQFGKPQDGLFRAHPLLGGGHDQEAVAEDPVVLDGRAELFRLQGLELMVHAAALQPLVVQQLSELLGAVFLEHVGSAGVAPELDPLVAELAHRLERAGHVAGEIAADRVELQGDRDLLRRGGRFGSNRRVERPSGRQSHACLQKSSSRTVHHFLPWELQEPRFVIAAEDSR